MKIFPDTRIFLQIGPLNIYWYAVIIMTGALLCYWICRKNIEKMGYPKTIAEDLFLGAFAFGIIGARLWFCAFYNLSYYLQNPIEILQVYDGGLAIQGGIVAGVLFGIYFAKKHRLNFFRFADAVVPNLLLAQAIGRWGNFVNQEAYGGVVNESFYNIFPSFIKDMMFIDGAYRMPTFLYESIGNLLVFVFIVFIYKKYLKPKRGDLAYMYLVGYGVVRFYVEGLRTDSLMFGPIRMAQLTSLIFIIVGVIGLFGVFRKIFKAKKPIILWDLDGTLLDTEPAIIESYRHLFNKYSTVEAFDEEKQLEVLGPPLCQMFPIYFPGNDVDKLIEEYRETNQKLHATHVKPMINAKETLSNLKQAGYRMGIVSTKAKEVVELGLNQNDMSEYFEVIIGQKEVNKGKPDPMGILKAVEIMGASHDDLIYVGDTKTDVEAATRAGAYSIGYLFNEKRSQVLKDAKPNRIIQDLKEIETIVKEDHGWTYNMM